MPVGASALGKATLVLGILSQHAFMAAEFVSSEGAVRASLKVHALSQVASLATQALVMRLMEVRP